VETWRPEWDRTAGNTAESSADHTPSTTTHEPARGSSGAGSDESKDGIAAADADGTVAAPVPVPVPPNAAPGTTFSVRVESGGAVGRCPRHAARLIPAEERHYSLRLADGRSPYACCHEQALLFKAVHGHHPCRSEEVYVCGDDDCRYAVCYQCADSIWPRSTKYAAVATAAAQALKRGYAEQIGPVALFVLLAMYIPATKSSVEIVVCHAAVGCTYDGCYEHMTTFFIVALACSVTLLAVLSAGLPLWLLASLWPRYQQLRGVSPAQWAAFLQRDHSALSGLYRKYEVRFMLCEPLLLLTTKAALVAAVLLPEAAGSTQLLAILGVEVLNAVFFALTNPFANVWVDAVSSAARVHQITQLGLAAFFRSQAVARPDDQTLGYVMFGALGAFTLIAVAVFYRTVVAPFRAWRFAVTAAALERRERSYLREARPHLRAEFLAALVVDKAALYGKVHVQVYLTQLRVAIAAREAATARQEAATLARSAVFVPAAVDEEEQAAPKHRRALQRLFEDAGKAFDQATLPDGVATAVLVEVGYGVPPSGELVELLMAHAKAGPWAVTALAALLPVLPVKDMRGARVAHAVLRSTLVADADFRGADFAGVACRGVVFQNADLRGLRTDDGTTFVAPNPPAARPKVVLQHAAAVSCVAFAPDSAAVATACRGGRVRLWRCPLGELLHELEGHAGAATAIAFSPAGAPVASAGVDGTVRLWDAASGALQRVLRHSAAVTSVAFQPEAHGIAAAASDGAVRVWDCETGAPLITFPRLPTRVNAIRFSGRLTIVAACDGDGQVCTVRRLDLPTRGQAMLPGYNTKGTVMAVACHAPAFVAASWVEDDDDMIGTVNTATGEQHFDECVTSGRVLAVACSADGAQLAAGGTDAVVHLYSAHPLQPMRDLADHTGAVTAVAFSPDGLVIASASEDATVRLWANHVDEAQETAGHSSIVDAVAVSPNGAFAASAGDTSARLWDAASGAPVAAWTGLRDDTGSVTEMSAVCFSCNSRLVAYASIESSVVGVRETDGGGLRCEIDYGGATATTRVGNMRVAFSPTDPNLLATASRDGAVRVWDTSCPGGAGTAAAKLVAVMRREDDGPVRGLAFSADGLLLASGQDRHAHVWETESGTAVASFADAHASRVRRVAFGAGAATLASLGDEGTVKLWNVQSGTAFYTIDGCSDFAFSADCAVVAAICGRAVLLIDAATGAALHRLEGHDDDVRCVAFSPDGAIVATGANDRSVRQWRVETGEARGVAEGHSDDVTHVAWSPDGACLLSGSEDNTVRCWWAVQPPATRRVSTIRRTMLEAELEEGVVVFSAALSAETALVKCGDTTRRYALDAPGAAGVEEATLRWRSDLYRVFVDCKVGSFEEALRLCVGPA
jgi:WD40 repeat protein